MAWAKKVIAATDAAGETAERRLCAVVAGLDWAEARTMMRARERRSCALSNEGMELSLTIGNGPAAPAFLFVERGVLLMRNPVVVRAPTSCCLGGIRSSRIRRSQGKR